MRITSINNIMDTYKTQKSTTVENKKTIKSKDVVDISSMAKDYQIAQKAVAQSPDIRMEKVENIKYSVESGNYNIGAKEIADKIVDNMFDTKA